MVKILNGFMILKPFTLLKSFSLFVIRINPLEIAVAAINLFSNKEAQFVRLLKD